MLWFTWRAFRKTRGRHSIWQAVGRGKDPASFTVFLEDSAAVIGMVITMAGTAVLVVTEKPVCDGAASVAIGGSVRKTLPEVTRIFVGPEPRPQDPAAL